VTDRPRASISGGPWRAGRAGRAGQRLDQRPRVVVAGICEEGTRRAFLHHAPGAQDDGARGIPRDEAEVVRDEDDGAALLRARAIMRSSTSRWVSVSSAVVGSSARRSRGRSSMTEASMMRWRMPPENSWG
jgi:hypothetical protein